MPEPRLRGAGDALDAALLRAIVAQNEGMVDLFLLVVDRDCNRRQHVERALAREQDHERVLLHCLAVEEVEVWMLALFEPAEIGASWQEVRAECDPKERFAEPLLARLGPSGPGRGRKRAMAELGKQWRRVCQLCPELDELRRRIARWLASRG